MWRVASSFVAPAMVGLASCAAAACGLEPAVFADEPQAAQPAKGAPRGPSPAERDARLTKENYDKIQPGMTRDEVLALLGPFNSLAGSGRDWKLGWHPRDKRGQQIEVHLHDGKVTSKHST